MPSAGTPTMTRIIATTGSDPAGTPAVPTPPRMQTSMTTICCVKVSSMLKNWARNRTVTPSNKAVPFWLAVAPTVRTKRAIFRGSCSCSSAARRANVSEALDEAVEKATIMGSRTPRKNLAGDMPPSSQTTSG